MKTQVTIFNKQWCDLIFEGKNKAYGAYIERQRRFKTQLIALFISISILTTSACIPLFFKSKPVVHKPPFDANELSVFDITPPIIPLIEPPKTIQTAFGSTIEFTEPIIVENDNATDKEMSLMETITSSNATISFLTHDGLERHDGEELLTSVGAIADDNVYIYVEQNAEFPGGIGQLYNYLAKTIKYPALAQENRITGKVILQFIVDKNGKISDIKTMRSIDRDCDEEAIKAVKRMPTWKPAKMNGQPVNVLYTLPVSFQFAE